MTNTVNSAQQVTAVQSSRQDSSHPQYLAQSVSYTAWGAVSQRENGCVGSGCVNAQETYVYNNHLQPVMIELGTTGNATADYCLVYNYYSDVGNPTSCATPSQGTKDNGTVIGYLYQDSVGSSFSHTASYAYDALKRLSTAVATGNSTYNLTFGYDRYGNMTCVTNGQTNGPCPNWAFNTSTNQLTTSGFTYDAAGDLTKDSSNVTAHTYQWDAEGRVASVDSGSTWAFTYNAVGDRVQWAYTGGAYQFLFDANGGWLGNYGVYTLVRWDDAFFVEYTSSETYFNHVNQISSTTYMTNHAGTPAEDMLFYPWGDVWQSAGSGGYNFADLPFYDTTTNTNLTTFRVYSPNLGRWFSTDPVRPCTCCPQGQNLYGYVKDSPTNAIDPGGDQDCEEGWAFPGPAADLCFCCSEDQIYRAEHAQACMMMCGMLWPPGSTGGDSDLGYVTCTCYLDSPNIRGNGCHYECGCSNGTTQPWWIKCAWIDRYAFSLCPGELTLSDWEPTIYFCGGEWGD